VNSDCRLTLKSSLDLQRFQVSTHFSGYTISLTEAEVPQMTEPRKIPFVNITLPEKQDSLTLFSPQDHWLLRAFVHTLRTLENIAVKVGMVIAALVLAWKYGPW
jgi:hypothetical protein